jgi:ATP:corrinoid adenosyltransferase
MSNQCGPVGTREQMQAILEHGGDEVTAAVASGLISVEEAMPLLRKTPRQQVVAIDAIVRHGRQGR